MKLINSMSQIYSLQRQMYFQLLLLSTWKLREATTRNTCMCLQARSKELKCCCCCIFSPYMTVAVDMCHFTYTVASFQFCHFAWEDSWYFTMPPWFSPYILLQEKFLQFDWLGAVVFQLNLKYLHVKITNLLRVVV